MGCVSIVEVVFLQSSKVAIEDIRRVIKSWGMLSKIIPVGVMQTIFSGNKPFISAYNISTTDLELLAKFLKTLPVIQRKIIEDIAPRPIERQIVQALERTGKEAQFYKGIVNGCSIQ